MSPPNVNIRLLLLLWLPLLFTHLNRFDWYVPFWKEKKALDNNSQTKNSQFYTSFSDRSSIVDYHCNWHACDMFRRCTRVQCTLLFIETVTISTTTPINQLLNAMPFRKIVCSDVANDNDRRHWMCLFMLGNGTPNIHISKSEEYTKHLAYKKEVSCHELQRNSDGTLWTYWICRFFWVHTLGGRVWYMCLNAERTCAAKLHKIVCWKDEKTHTRKFLSIYSFIHSYHFNLKMCGHHRFSSATAD